MPSTALLIAAKDLRAEFRTKRTLNSMLIFSVMVILAFRFAFTAGDGGPAMVAPSALWITFILAGMFALSASFSKEKDQETFQSLLLCPGSRTSIYLGKMLSSFILITMVELFSIVAMAVFFEYDFGGPERLAWLAVVVVLGTLGFVGVGTLVAAMTMNTQMREVMLPVLVLPLVVFTIIMPAVTATAKVLGEAGMADVGAEVRLLLTFALVYIIAALLLFDYVIEE
ncbi:MAG: heme ABC transporter permease [Euryarchaeota archaeon]|nr:heme ABC transporter permease [Euryarchaeota archaeon]